MLTEKQFVSGQNFWNRLMSFDEKKWAEDKEECEILLKNLRDLGFNLKHNGYSESGRKFVYFDQKIIKEYRNVSGLKKYLYSLLFS